MNIRIAFLTATAMGLALGAAHAGNTNKSYIDQDGSDNSALITQSGTGNQAGTSGKRILQDGTNNELTISQSGNNNEAGTGGAGIDQVGGNNFLSITQQGADYVLQVQQTANGVTGTEDTNKAIVSQTWSQARISNITQTYSGDGTLAADRNLVDVNQRNGAWNRVGDSSGTGNGLFQNGKGNTIDIDQTYAGHWIVKVEQLGNYNNTNILQQGSATSNGVGTVSQSGDANVATITQSGGGNRVALVDQDGGNNSSTLTFTGNRNGNGGFALSFNDRGLAQGEVIQNNSGLGSNTISYTVLGDDNLFAFKQDGTGNSITGTVGNVLASDDNQVAVLQTGNNNVTSFSQVGGGGNSLSVSQ